jgi:hypothetical protein
MSINDDGTPRKMIYLGTYPSETNHLIIPREILQLAEQKLAAERATREAAAEKAKLLQSASTAGKLRRLLGGGD